MIGNSFTTYLKSTFEHYEERSENRRKNPEAEKSRHNNLHYMGLLFASIISSLARNFFCVNGLQTPKWMFVLTAWFSASRTPFIDLTERINHPQRHRNVIGNYVPKAGRQDRWNWRLGLMRAPQWRGVRILPRVPCPIRRPASWNRLVITTTI